MKKAIYFIGLAFALLLAAASCQKAPFLTFNGQKSFTFKDTGGSETITFSCNRAWTAKSSGSWLTVSPAQGDANEEGVRVTITCAANTTYDPRNTTVTIMSEGLTETISVSQETNYGLIVSPTTFNLTNAEQDIDIEVQKNVQYSVAIDKDCSDWISLGGTKALTTDKVTIHIAANTSYDDREGRITFKRIDGDLSQTVTVKQSQTNGLFITTSEYNLSNESHNLTVEVKANVEFEVTSQAEWIKFVETKALKASTISLSIDANESYDNRTGTVIVKQTNGDLTGTITINQHQTDGLFVSPTEFELDNTEQSVDIVVEQNVAYNVVIPDDAKTWIAVAGSSQTKALSKETVTLNIAKNTTYDDREASVTIKQVDGTLAETVKIKQSHSEGILTDQDEYEIEEFGGQIEVKVESNVEYNIKTDVGWIHRVETKALSKSTVSLLIDKNDGVEARQATVILYKTDGTLSKNIIVKQAPTVHVSSVTLDKNSLYLLEGDETTLKATVIPDNSSYPQIDWKSSDVNVATVDENGKVKAISSGIATITAKSDGKEITCSVDVSLPIDFADEKVKSTLLKHFDTNGDGEISFTEAASVTSIENVFVRVEGGWMHYSNDDYTSFDEFKYFTKITSVDEYAFYGCNLLKSIQLPNQIIEVSLRAFEGCSSLDKIVFPAALTTIGVEAFYGCSALTSVKIPNSVKSIGVEAFYGCSALTSVTIPDSVNSIGSSAFKYCSSLTSISIPDGIQTIEQGVFEDCEKLENVILPEHLTSIPKYLFSRCKSLKTIDLPSNLNSIGDNAFQDCVGLQSITFPEELTKIGSFAFYGCTGITSLSFPSNLKTIGTSSFSRCSISNLEIPSSITNVGDAAFCECHSLNTVIIHNGLTNLSACLFCLNENLKNVSIPNSIASIQSQVFSGCHSLEEIVLPENVKSIGYDAFEDCPSLKTCIVKAILPPTLTYDPFGHMDGYSMNCSIYVPAESVPAYKSANIWSYYQSKIFAIPSN